METDILIPIFLEDIEMIAQIEWSVNFNMKKNTNVFAIFILFS